MDNFIYDEEGYDPDGYFNDPSLEELLADYQISDKKPKKHRYSHEAKATPSHVVDERLRLNYTGRVTRSGPYRSRRDKLRLVCGMCGVEFLQTAESLFRSAYTRCNCNRRIQKPTIPGKTK
jgi:hypothetical protein